MKLEEKKRAQIGKGEYVWFNYSVPEVKTEKGCIDLAYQIAKVGNIDLVDCRGYHDMDTHENYAFFESIDEFTEGLSDLKKIDVDTISIRFVEGESTVGVKIHPVWNDESGTNVSVSGMNRALVEKIAGAIEKISPGK